MAMTVLGELATTCSRVVERTRVVVPGHGASQFSQLALSWQRQFWNHGLRAVVLSASLRKANYPAVNQRCDPDA